MTKTFENWLYEEVELTFGIKQVDNLAILDAWLESTYNFDEQLSNKLLALQQKLFRKMEAWNEDELKFFFISPFIELVGYRETPYNAFTQRTLTAQINGIKLTGRVDFVLATGQQIVAKPFFCLHEYKQKFGKGTGDPRGQLLIEMLTAQHLNQDNNMPIYGAYVMGAEWRFVVLYRQEYALSKPYFASNNDIFNLFAILRKVDEYIMAILKVAK